MASLALVSSSKGHAYRAGLNCGRMHGGCWTASMCRARNNPGLRRLETAPLPQDIYLLASRAQPHKREHAARVVGARVTGCNFGRT